MSFSLAPAATAPQPPTPSQLARLAQQAVALHDSLLDSAGWPAAPAAPPAGDLWSWLQANHRNNSLLWAEEDLARRTTVADTEIAANKRAIDGYNQARNDATERVDELLLLALDLVDPASAHGDTPQARVPAGARLNSETAGSMVDRLSILSLKIHAMRLQSRRGDADEAHRSASRARLERLLQQRHDLAGCLQTLLADAAAGRAYFKVYRQFKMYNDPRFNPVLVQERSATSGGPAVQVQDHTPAGRGPA